MGRMHSGSKGKSGSSKPYIKEVPSWQAYKAKEVEALVVKLAKDKHSAAKIGLILRDMYGIASVQTTTQKSVTEILTEKGITKQLPQDMIDLIRKYIGITKHVEQNNQDKTAKRGLVLAQSKLARLAKYYKRTGKIAADWKFDTAKAGIYLE
jgi:small subunit ribosomal protein S15